MRTASRRTAGRSRIAEVLEIRAVALLVVMCGMMIASSALFAQQSPKELKADTVRGPAPISPPRINVSFVVSGGVSLGSYQAGLGWGMIELLRRSQEPEFRQQVRLCRSDDRRVKRECAPTDASWHELPAMRLSEAVGASAGNINALLSAVEWCRKRDTNVPPEQSLFWKLWTWTGWEQLFPESPGEGRREALFQREFFNSLLTQLVDTALKQSATQPGCSIPLGVVTTRLAPDSVRLTPTSPIWAATQRFVAVFRLVAKEDGGGFQFQQFLVPKVTTRTDTPAFYAVSNDSAAAGRKELGSQEAQAFGKVLIVPPEAASGALRDSSVYEVIKASGAFPFVFAPVSLSYWDGTEYLDGRCSASVDGCTMKHSWFVDGGVFDNNPLDLAITMYRAATPKDDTLPPTQIVYISPATLRGALRTAREHSQEENDSPSRGINALFQLAGQGLTAATQYELQAASRHLAIDKTAQSWVHTSSRASPIVGEHLQHFAAFLGRPFREFDYYAGIYDAFDYVARDVLCAPPKTQRSQPSDGYDIEQCVAVAKRGLLTADAKHLGPVAPGILAALFDYEHRGRIELQKDAVLDSTTARHDSLVKAVWHALRANSGMEATHDCSQRYGAWALTCADGFSGILHALKADTPSARIITRAAGAKGCTRHDWSRVPPPDDCVGEWTLGMLIQDENGMSDRIVSDALRRIWEVEHKLAEDTLTNHPGWAKAASFGFVSVVSARKSENRHSTSSVPREPVSAWQRTARFVLPYAFSANTEGGGFEVSYLPSIYLKEWLAVGALVTPVNWRPHQDRARAQAIYGGDLVAHLSARSIFLSDLDVGGGAMSSGLHELSPDLTGAAYLFAGHLRVGTRYFFHGNHTVIRNGHWTMTLGLADVNGLLYWLFK